MSILDQIFSQKVVEVEAQKKLCPLAELRILVEQTVCPLDFIAALRRNLGQRPALIAEIKYASPSRGVICADFDPLALARIYQENGASAISVLTDERYFKGSLEYLRQIAAISSHLPLLRKDFIFDPYQIYEARAAGADAILLIAAYLEPAHLRNLHTLADKLGMAALVEVHSKAELDAVLAVFHPLLLGINNRNLHDFSVNLDVTLRLRPGVPAGICLVAESGIRTRVDVDRLAEAGIDAVLVGEALVTAPDVATQVRNLA